MSIRSVSVAFLGILPVLAACGGGDSGERRVIEIVQADGACSPVSIDLSGGERVTFRVVNQGKKDQEIEGIDGTKLEELLVPAGKTRSIDYTAPKDESVRKLKCYTPGGPATIIELKVSGSAERGQAGGGPNVTTGSRKTNKAAKETVAVALSSFEVIPNRASAGAGPIKFLASNTSPTDVHELAVLRVKADGSYENTGEIEGIDPGKGGEITLDLPAGKYLLACLLVPGEAGSKEDHFKMGMRHEFEVK